MYLHRIMLLCIHIDHIGRWRWGRTFEPFFILGAKNREKKTSKNQSGEKEFGFAPSSPPLPHHRTKRCVGKKSFWNIRILRIPGIQTNNLVAVNTSFGKS
jgi:hypothetical protein